VLAAPANRLLRRNSASQFLHRKKVTVLPGEECNLLFHAHTLATWLLSLSAKNHDGEDKGPCDDQWL
jgi:hypothetical protein